MPRISFVQPAVETWAGVLQRGLGVMPRIRCAKTSIHQTPNEASTRPRRDAEDQGRVVEAMMYTMAKLQRGLGVMPRISGGVPHAP